MVSETGATDKETAATRAAGEETATAERDEEAAFERGTETTGVDLVKGSE